MGDDDDVVAYGGYERQHDDPRRRAGDDYHRLQRHGERQHLRRRRRRLHLPHRRRRRPSTAGAATTIIGSRFGDTIDGSPVTTRSSAMAALTSSSAATARTSGADVRRAWAAESTGGGHRPTSPMVNATTGVDIGRHVGETTQSGYTFTIAPVGWVADHHVKEVERSPSSPALGRPAHRPRVANMACRRSSSGSERSRS